MAKKQHIIKLIGRLHDGTAAKVHQTYDVKLFSDEEDRFRIWPKDSKTIYLHTAKGRYDLVKHEQLNIYRGEFNGCKVHVTIKCIVGKLIYWA